MRVIALGIILALAGCSAEPVPRPRVEVLSPGDGIWRATWHSHEPIRRLRFERPAYPVRDRGWRVVTPGYAMQSQSIVLRDGASPVEALTVEFPVDTSFLPRDYELFHVFSDGSVAVYTGHFFATVNDGLPIRDVEFAGVNVFVDGSPGPDGTYAYVGPITPVDSVHVTEIVDPALPQWLVTELRHRLPLLLDHFAARTGKPLSKRPRVLVSYAPGPGRTIDGAALEGLVAVRVSGDAWQDDNPWTVRSALQLVAHELAHLWLHEFARAEVDAPPWLYEGAAEAFAEDALLAVGVLDDAGMRAARDDARADCRAGRRTAYSCGRVAAWWTQDLVARASPDADLFSFWRGLAARARARDGYYGVDEYFAQLGALGVPAEDIARLRAFMNGGELP